jgi:APA family basic amino acid/polyamine antiporter
MVSIGTLLAFVIVCAAVWLLRVRRPDLHRPFRTPLVPFVPIMGIIVSLALMAGLNGITLVRLLVWLIIGLIIYFTYSVKHSLVRNPELRANNPRSEISPVQAPSNR